MEEAFTKVVQQIFNNWTALKLAVDHCMGGPNSRQTALEYMNYMVQYCLNESTVSVEGIQEALEDILDEEFETICEDGSPKEIATLLYKFVLLLKEGNVEQCDVEYQKLPVLNSGWLNIPTNLGQQARIVDETSSEDENSDTTMEDEWVEVRSRRKR